MPPRHKNTGVSDPSVIEERIVMPSTLEKIDESFYRHIDEKLNIHTTTKNGFQKVPVLWLTAERAFQIKNNKELRDSKGSFILPIMTIERTSIVKDPASKGIFFANIPPENDAQGGSIVIARKIKQDKTKNFANADSYRRFGQLNFPFKNEKVVYQSVSIPMPVYIDINYSITLKTEYQQQMNDMLAPFITRTGGINYFVFGDDQHSYEAFIEGDFSQGNNLSTLETDEKMYETTIDIRALGYLIGDDKNQDQPKMVVRENRVDVKVTRERVMVGDIPDHIERRDQSVDGKYRGSGENI